VKSYSDWGPVRQKLRTCPTLAGTGRSAVVIRVNKPKQDWRNCEFAVSDPDSRLELGPNHNVAVNHISVSLQLDVLMNLDQLNWFWWLDLILKTR